MLKVNFLVNIFIYLTPIVRELILFLTQYLAMNSSIAYTCWKEEKT